MEAISCVVFMLFRDKCMGIVFSKFVVFAVVF